MFEFKNQAASIWRAMRPTSLGTVLWALERDRQALLDFKRALESVDSPDRFSEALMATSRAAANSVGQLALHEFGADPASSPHIEPRDTRWSVFRVLPEEIPVELCRSIAHYPPFIGHARATLASTIARIKVSPAGDKEGAEGDHVSELLREFLIFFGIGMGEALMRYDADFICMIGHVAELNQGTVSHLYPFSKPGNRLNLNKEKPDS